MKTVQELYNEANADFVTAQAIVDQTITDLQALQAKHTKETEALKVAAEELERNTTEQATVLRKAQQEAYTQKFEAVGALASLKQLLDE